MARSHPAAAELPNRRTVRRLLAAALAASGSSIAFARADAPPRVVIPIECSHGPAGQHQEVAITSPASVRPGQTYTVRIEEGPSGKISYTGLHYIFDMSYDWLIPSGTRLIEGSAHVVPNTGTPNVRPGARVFRTGDSVRLVLPAHVEDGSSYTPPAFEFELIVTATPGATLRHAFSQYRVTANAFLVGNVETTCQPVPQPFTASVTRVEQP